MIEVVNLTKKYGKHLAVDNMSFTVNKGEILGFLGPNGAGKSTTMNILTGYLSATSGTIKIGGIDLLENPIEAKKKIGYLPEIPPLYLDMVVRDYLTFVCDLKKVEMKGRKEHLDEIIKVVRLEDVEQRLIKNLSKGYKQRVGLAASLVGSPDVLILDEPTVGLDPKQIIEIRNLIKDLSASHTIILSSHILPEVSAVCDRIMIINKGKIVASDTTHRLSHLMAGGTRLAIRLKQVEHTFLEALANLEGVYAVTPDKEREVGTMDYIIDVKEGLDARSAIFNLCAETHHPLLMMKSLDLSLEEIFLQLTTTQQEEEDSEHVSNL